MSPCAAGTAAEASSILGLLLAPSSLPAWSTAACKRHLVTEEVTTASGALKTASLLLASANSPKREATSF